jgi:hypothetical protein
VPNPDSAVDHFKCHRMRITPGTERFTRDVTTALDDQFTRTSIVAALLRARLRNDAALHRRISEPARRCHRRPCDGAFLAGVRGGSRTMVGRSLPSDTSECVEKIKESERKDPGGSSLQTERFLLSTDFAHGDSV